MIVHNCEQGSDEWHFARLGLPTSSEFKKIITPATGQFSKQSRPYMFFLVAEILLQRSLSPLNTVEWVERGKELEPEAVKFFEFHESVETRPVGFITDEARRFGCSPDRLIVGKNAGAEIKCPAPQTMVSYLVDGLGADYRPQVQGQMLVAEFEWVDFCAYHPELPPFILRTYRDEPYIAKLRDALDQFCAEKDAMLEKLRASGFFAERDRIMTPTDVSAEQWASELRNMGIEE